MKECPELRVIAKLRWQLFITLTFRKAELSDRVRASMLIAFVRQVENATRVPPRRLLWCCREELGEKGGRLHFHLLMGGLPAGRVHVGQCFRIMRIWEKRIRGGFARARLFDPMLDGVGYVLKGLSGEDFYESGKFSQKAQLMLSESCFRVVGRGFFRERESVNTGEKSYSAWLRKVKSTWCLSA